MVGRLVGWLVDWLFGWSVGRLVGRLVDRASCYSTGTAVPVLYRYVVASISKRGILRPRDVVPSRNMAIADCFGLPVDY